MRRSLRATLTPALALALGGCFIAVNEPARPPVRPPSVQEAAGANRNPIIRSFTANPGNEVAPGQPLTFTVAVDDPDGDLLQFNWSATAGTLSTNTGETVTWFPPAQPGTYSVQVIVTDPRGGSVTGAQNLLVTPKGARVDRQPEGGVPSVPQPVERRPTPTPMTTASPSGAPVAPGPVPTPFPPTLSPGRGASMRAFERLATPRLLTARAGHTAVVVGSWLYVLGGYDSQGGGQRLTQVERAEIAPDGSLGPFSAAPSLTTARSHHTTVIVGRYLYVIGGTSRPGQPLPTVERAEIQHDGSLGPFSLEGCPALDEPREGHTSVVSGGYVYNIGGAVPGAFGTTSVERAAIQPDGSLSEFSRVGQPVLQTGRIYHASAVVGPHVFVVGGFAGTGRTGAIERATLAADGSLGPFAPLELPALKPTRNHHTAIAIDDDLYVLGGFGEAGTMNDVQRAPGTTGDQLAPFSYAGAAQLFDPRYDQAVVQIGDYVYVIGGYGEVGATLERTSLITR